MIITRTLQDSLNIFPYFGNILLHVLETKNVALLHLETRIANQRSCSTNLLSSN